MDALSRPATAAAAALAAGIATRASTSTSLTATASALALIAVALAMLTKSNRRLATYAVALCLLFALGFVRTSARLQAAAELVTHAATATQLHGVVKDVSVHEYGTRFVLATATGNIQITLRGPAAVAHTDVLNDGQHVGISGPLDIAVRKRNPADFDYRRFLFSRSIWGATSLRDPGRLVINDLTPSPVTKGIGDARQYVAHVVRARSDVHVQPVLHALLLGDRSFLDDELQETLSRAGLMHLLAVSGLHVLLVGLAVHRTLFSLLVRTRISWRAMEAVRTPLTILLLAGYAALTGGSPSVVRAVLMSTLIILGSVLQRRGDSLNSLGVAAFCLLLLRPETLYSVGFQLSFCAVAAIVTLGGRISELLVRRTGRRAGFIAQSVATSLAATAGTAPILLLTFGYVPLAGIFLNVAAIPLAAATLAAGFLMTAFHGIIPEVASLFQLTAARSIDLLLIVASFSEDHLESLVVVFPSGNVSRICLLASVVIVTAHLAQTPARWKVSILSLATVVIGVLHPAVRQSADVLDIVFLDVGQGDAAVIRTPDARFIVIDTGPPGRTTSAAKRTLIPQIRSMGARSLDVILVSHPHADHDGGVRDLTQAFNTEHLVASVDDDRYAPQTHRALLDGDQLQVGGRVMITVLNPSRTSDHSGGQLNSVNNRSIVIRLDFGETCILFTGDIEQEAERVLAMTPDRLQCELIKVAHHGSRTSSSWPFLKATTLPTKAPFDPGGFAVISVGENNRFGLPDEEVVARWQRRRVVFATNEGAVWFKSDGERIYLHEWRKDTR